MNESTTNKIDEQNSLHRFGSIMVQVAGPALAIIAVANVAFFLIEVFYGGALVGRVKWIFALFSFAAVLISRISIEEGYERASFYGLVLGFATMLVASRFMQGNLLILIGILIFVWWVAGRLTWDCTFIDNTRDATGQGMIDLAVDRVEKFRKRNDKKPSVEPVDSYYAGSTLDNNRVTESDKSETTSQTTSPTTSHSAWESFSGIFLRRRQANTPGLWAFYFLLGGLPLFGIGQIFMKSSDSIGQRAAAVHFSFYMLALLGLLMLSSILGLNRYLQKNNSSVPQRLARRWMITGTLMAIGIIGFCFLLPRPTPKYSVQNWLPKLVSKSTTPSDVSFGNDGQEQDENNSNMNSGPRSREDRNKQGGGQDDGKSGGGNQQKSDQGAAQDTKGGKSSGGKAAGKQGSGGNKKSASKSSGTKSKQKGGQNDGKQKGSGGDSDKKSEHKSNEGESEKGESKKGGSKSGEEAKSDQKSGEQSKGRDGKKGGMKSQDEQKKSSSRASQSRRNRNRSRPSEQKSQQPSESKKQDDKPKSKGLLAGLGKFIQLLMWLIALLVVGWFAIKYRAQIGPWIRSFLSELADFWNRLWNRPRKTASAEVAAAAAVVSEQRRVLPGFNHYSNPFADGSAQSWSAERLINYTFDAFEAWCADFQCPRDPQQTAHEFVKQASVSFNSIGPEAFNLAELYSRVAYAGRKISSTKAQSLSTLWEKLSTLYRSSPPPSR